MSQMRSTASPASSAATTRACRRSATKGRGRGLKTSVRFTTPAPHITLLSLTGLGQRGCIMDKFGKAWRRGLMCAAAASAISVGAAPARADYFYTDLGTLPGYTYSSLATAISPDGAYIAGYSTNYNAVTGPTYRPWVWSNGSLHDLGNVLGGALYFRIGGVNDSGQVVGTDYYSNGSSHTFITSAGGGTQSLDSLGTTVTAFDINNSGQVVGEVDGRAYIWTPGS